MLTLYGPLNKNGVNTLKLRAALEEVGAAYTYVTVDLGKGDHKKPEFLGRNPHGKVPVLVDDDFSLPESDAILFYIGEKADAAHLLPSDARGRATALRWMDFASTGLYPAMSDAVLATQSGEPPRKSPSGELPLDRIERACRVLEGEIAKRPYLTGEYSIADIGVCAALYSIRERLGFDLTAFPATAAYFERITTRPAWKKALAG